MPVKRKWSVWEFPKRTASRHTIYDRVVDSHVGCQYDYLKDSHADTTISKEEDTSSGEIIDWSAWIEYSNSRYKCFNPCRHIVKRLQRSGGGQIFLNHYVNSVQEEECNFDEYEYDSVRTTIHETLTLYPNVLDMGSVVDVGKVENFAYLEGPDFAPKVLILDRIALDTMIPELDAGIDIPVFIGEILELKTMYKQFLSVSNYKNFLGLVSDFKNKPLKELSSSWLAYAFGWAPFLSDVKRIIIGLWNMFDKIDAYLGRENTWMTLHFKKNLNPETFKPAEWFNRVEGSAEFDAYTHYDDWYFARTLFKRIVVKQSHYRSVGIPTYHATLFFKYRMPAFLAAQSFWVQWLAACLKYWRIKAFSPAQAWELIPFSFVIDWFLSVGPWLEQFDKDWFDVQIIIRDFCRSIKYVQTDWSNVEPEVLVFNEPYSSVNTADTWTCLPQSTTQVQTLECYWREVGKPLPGPGQLINGRTPRGAQWISAAALLAQLGSRR